MAEQALATVQACEIDIRPQHQLGNTEIRSVRILGDDERVIRPAQPAAVDAGLRRPARSLGGDVGKRDKRRDRPLGRSQIRQHRADGRVIARARRNGYREVAQVFAGEREVGGSPVGVADPVVGRAHQGKLMGMPGQPRQMLGQLDAWHGGRDRLEFAAHFRGR